MITMRYGPFTLGEAFFRIPPEPERVDLLHCRQVPSAEGLAMVDTQGTLLIDLARPEGEIFAGFEKDTKYEIRRAETKDGVQCALLAGGDITDAALADFEGQYRTFAGQKGIPPINAKRLGQLRKTGGLRLGLAKAPDGSVLAWHAYLIAEERARLLYSLSLFRDTPDAAHRNLVGRANRLLHWKDMTALGALGTHTYDFGGYYRGGADPAKLRINQFKAEFGGVQRVEFNGFLYLNLKGRIAGGLYGLATSLPSLLRR